jgi:hypothetical protein
MELVMQTETKTMFSKIALSTALVLGAATASFANVNEYEGPVLNPAQAAAVQLSAPARDAFASARMTVRAYTDTERMHFDRIDSGKDF